MARSLFIISTASQAFFLSHSPQLVTEESILILTVKKKEQKREIMAHLGNLPWEKIFIWNSPLDSPQASVFGKLLRIKFNMLFLKMRYSYFERVYIGSYNNLIHLSILNGYETANNTFLLYDGLQLVAVHTLRKLTKRNNLRELPRLYKLVGFKVPKIASLNYISPLPLKIRGDDSFLQIENKLPYKKKTYDENTIYFIGQPLPLIGAVDQEFYLNTLKNFKEKYNNLKVIYFPHPREDMETLEQISELMPVQNLDLIFEQFFLDSNEFAGKIYSFYSSVLVNLVFLQAKSKLYAVDIPSCKVAAESYKNTISSVYNYFRTDPNGKITVVTFD